MFTKYTVAGAFLREVFKKHVAHRTADSIAALMYMGSSAQANYKNSPVPYSQRALTDATINRRSHTHNWLSFGDNVKVIALDVHVLWVAVHCKMACFS